MLKKRKSNSVKNNSKYAEYHKKTQYFFYIGLFFALILAVILVVELCDFSKVRMPFREPTHIEIVDECSFIMGNLVHQIRDEDDCSIRCYNECVLIESDIKSSEFISGDPGCNTCNCYCK